MFIVVTSSDWVISCRTSHISRIRWKFCPFPSRITSDIKQNYSHKSWLSRNGNLFEIFNFSLPLWGRSLTNSFFSLFQYFVSYLNCLRVKEFNGALENLFKFFDSVNFTDKTKSYRYAALNLAMFNVKFNNRFVSEQKFYVQNVWRNFI